MPCKYTSSCGTLQIRPAYTTPKSVPEGTTMQPTVGMCVPSGMENTCRRLLHYFTRQALRLYPFAVSLHSLQRTPRLDCYVLLSHGTSHVTFDDPFTARCDRVEDPVHGWCSAWSSWWPTLFVVMPALMSKVVAPYPRFDDPHLQCYAWTS